MSIQRPDDRPSSGAKPMTFIQAVQNVLRHYANFEGRASRSEFWWFYLFHLFTVFGGLLIVMMLAGATQAAFGQQTAGPVVGILMLLLVLIWLGLAIPSLAVSVRRLHDTDHSGAWLLLAFVPFGFIVLLVWYLTPSSLGANRYGGDVMAKIANTF